MKKINSILMLTMVAFLFSCGSKGDSGSSTPKLNNSGRTTDQQLQYNQDRAKKMNERLKVEKDHRDQYVGKVAFEKNVVFCQGTAGKNAGQVVLQANKVYSWNELYAKLQRVVSTGVAYGNAGNGIRNGADVLQEIIAMKMVAEEELKRFDAYHKQNNQFNNQQPQYNYGQNPNYGYPQNNGGYNNGYHAPVPARPYNR